jgi:hypothetical protein
MRGARGRTSAVDHHHPHPRGIPLYIFKSFIVYNGPLLDVEKHELRFVSHEVFLESNGERF